MKGIQSVIKACKEHKLLKENEPSQFIDDLLAESDDETDNSDDNPHKCQLNYRTKISQFLFTAFRASGNIDQVQFDTSLKHSIHRNNVEGVLLAVLEQFKVRITLEEFVEYSTVRLLVDLIDFKLQYPEEANAITRFNKIQFTKPSTLSLSPRQLDDVAIIGTSMMLPGQCNSYSSLWDILTNKQVTTITVPKSRWNNVSLKTRGLIKDEETMQRMSKSHFIDLETAMSTFNFKQFKLTKLEADSIHPCQKLLLTMTAKALDDAGYTYDPKNNEVDKKTGVFVAASGFSGFTQSCDENGTHLTSGKSSAYSATATALSVIAGRISYSFGFTGPSMVLDTACSSSLVAIHHARRSLQLHECDVAVVAAVNVLAVDSSLACAVAGMLSADGICHTFDASANGYARGEGCGVVILRRVTDTRAQGALFYSIIRGSAVLQDGKSATLTAPNGRAQEELMRTAIRDAGVTPNDVTLLEAHGTGTKMGDPIETAAIANVFGKDRVTPSTTTIGDTDSLPLYVSSVKANIGHLEAAAGMAGLFSLVLGLQLNTAMANPCLTTLNPEIKKSVQQYPIHFPTESTPIDHSNGCLIGGLSSFGYCGTIAHVILQAPKPSEKKHCIANFTPLKSSQSHAINNKSDMIRDVAISAPSTTTSADSTSDNDELEEEMPCEGLVWQFSDTIITTRSTCKDGTTVRSTIDKVREVYATEQIFRSAMQQCDLVTKKLLGVTFSLLLQQPTDDTTDCTLNLNESRVALPLLVAVEFGLMQVWRAQDMYPSVLIGHGVGELVAAVLLEVLTIDNAIELAYRVGMHEHSSDNNASASIFDGIHLQRSSSDIIYMSNRNGSIIDLDTLASHTYWTKTLQTIIEFSADTKNGSVHMDLTANFANLLHLSHQLGGKCYVEIGVNDDWTVLSKQVMQSTTNNTNDEELEFYASIE